jgi:hypothetical protein
MSTPAPPQPSNALRIVGYASLFGVKDLAGDVVETGAFTRSLGRRPARDIAMLHQHEADAAIGRWDVVAEDDKGLFVMGRILSTRPTGAYAASLVRAGALDGLSIGFRTVRAVDDPARALRRLVEIDLLEISLVAFPMLPAARLSPFAFTEPQRSAA